MAVPFSFLVVEVEAPEDDERVARRHVILGPEGFDLLVVVTRGVWAYNEEPARLEGLLKAGEALS
jgi:hypothetical protein